MSLYVEVTICLLLLCTYPALTKVRRISHHPAWLFFLHCGANRGDDPSTLSPLQDLFYGRQAGWRRVRHAPRRMLLLWHGPPRKGRNGENAPFLPVPLFVIDISLLQMHREHHNRLDSESILDKMNRHSVFREVVTMLENDDMCG